MKDPTNERNDYGGRRMKLHDYQMEAAEGAFQRPFEKQKKISNAIDNAGEDGKMKKKLSFRRYLP